MPALSQTPHPVERQLIFPLDEEVTWTPQLQVFPGPS
jgi:hypothetical protein